MKLDNPFEFKPARPQPARPAHLFGTSRGDLSLVSMPQGDGVAGIAVIDPFACNSSGLGYDIVERRLTPTPGSRRPSEPVVNSRGKQRLIHVAPS